MGSGREKATLHIRENGDGTFDLEELPVGTFETVTRSGLTASEVADVIVAGPKSLPIHCFSIDDARDECLQTIHAELVRRGRGFVRAQPCATCGNTGKVDGAPCPDCTGTWNLEP